jgi:ribonuclease-3
VGRVDIEALEERFGLTFRDKELIEAALIHSSAELGVSNERLEFLGDAVLQLVVSRHLYTQFPSFDEGELTKLRARVVNKKTLAQVALRSHIDGLLVLGESLKKAEKAPNPSILADAYEAVIGAIYLDRGMSVVKKFIRLTLLKELGNIQVDRDFKSELQEEAIKRFKCYPEYNLLRIEGPEHAKKFWVEVKVGGRRFGSGKGLSRKEAEKAAAKRALRNWRRPVAKEQRR